jgi:hypothetical protein
MLRAKLHAGGLIAETSSDTWLSVFQERGWIAFTFDCESTLVESADVHLASMAQVASKQG